MTLVAAYYSGGEPGRIEAGRYVGSWQPTGHAGGAWQPGEQHMGPVSGLVLHAVEEFLRRREPSAGDWSIARISFDILGMIPDGPTEVEVGVLRPGRTIELLEAVAKVAGRAVVSARIWRLRQTDSQPVAGGEEEPLPPPQDWPVTPAFTDWQGGFVRSLQARVGPGAEPGRIRLWLQTLVDLVDGEPSSDLARFVGLADAANGVAVRLPPQRWLFPNVDLTLHLFRTPRADPATGLWVGFDTRVVFGPDGVGLTTSTLYDIDGPVGRAEQILTLRPLATAANP